ncbi:DinB family protein [Sphingobacterium sp. SGG-5]|uniref:DinB family protein n=1 Tax=Sphingobacterium sp. SGG-5 TaxID=2710881 RepID=UPI0013EDC1CC|nr:DinB family protein [Sphingobacterium sp. SGG-5]NGM60623.1 DinB family protein [Sphingobacterium sp. SGG-5]
MQETFKYIIQARRAFIALIEELTLEQLNHIPDGFNNNIIWNFGHIVVATQGLCYLRTGVRPDYTIKYGAAYTKGSKPTYTVSQEEVDDLKTLAITTIEQIEKDYHAGVFKEITPFATGTYHAMMPTIADVIVMTAGHDNLHFGYALAQRRIINNGK